MWIRSQDKKVIFDMTAECSIGIEKDGTIRGGKKDTILGKYPTLERAIEALDERHNSSGM